MKKAAELFDRVNTIEGVRVGRYEHGSNIFPVDLDSDVNISRFISALREHGVFVYPDEDNLEYIHLTVNPTILRRSNDDLFSAFADALTRGQ